MIPKDVRQRITTEAYLAAKRDMTPAVRREIINRARKWWSTYRGAIGRMLNQKPDGDLKVSAGGVGPSIIIRPGVTQDLDDGILSGKPWSQLKPEERADIVSKYFRGIWVPMRDGKKPEQIILGKETMQ